MILLTRLLGVRAVTCSSRHLHRTVGFFHHTELWIIGGLVVKLGSRMVDASLRTKLNSIRLAMQGAR